MTTKKTPPPVQSEHEDQVEQNTHHDLPADTPAGDLTRRHFIGGAAIGVAAAASGGSFIMSHDVGAHGRDREDWRDDRWNDRNDRRDCPRSGGRKDRVLLKGGAVMSLDPNVGNYTKADVLIEGKKIIAVQPNIRASNAQTVDCSGMIVMPGFINTHHHQYYTPQRAIIADGNILPGDDWPQEAYNTVAGQIWTTGRLSDNGVVIWDLGRSPYEPEDCYIAELVASLNQINQGVTTGIDTSQCSHTPAHTDAMIQGLMASGRRSLYDYSTGRSDQPGYEYPGAIGNETSGIGRLAKQYFSSTDQLVTLALNSASPALWPVARHYVVPMIFHGGGPGIEQNPTLVADDQTHIHGTSLNDAQWAVVADRGMHISIATTIEMQMGHGIPPIQKALDLGILPSLSSDVETNMTPEMFTIMRSTFTLQRMNIHTRNRTGEANVPPLLTCYQVLKMATIAGASAARLSSKVGTLTPGKEADIIILDGRTMNTAGFNNVPGAVVTLMDTSNVRHVMIAGAFRKWNFKLVGWNLDKLVREVERSRDRLFARIKSKPIPVDGLNSAPGYSPTPFGSCCVVDDYPTQQ